MRESRGNVGKKIGICFFLTVICIFIIVFNLLSDFGISEESIAFAKNVEAYSKEAIKKDIDIKDQHELNSVNRARQLVSSKGRNPRIVATSPAVADICNRLNLDLVGVCKSTVTKIPDRYSKVTVIGAPMSPDMEKVSSVQPDWILSPRSLQGDLQPKYEALNSEWGFLNLDSVQGMYTSIHELGIIFGREKEAKKLIDEYVTNYEKIVKKQNGKKKPKVMILMGLPGSYVIATPSSYVGNLVEMAGGENVYKNKDKAFLTVNTEDMKKKEPDVILRTAHAMPDEVVKMFDKEFKENSIWKHFEAVKKGRVFDLSYENSGMSANFNYLKSLEEIQPMIYAMTKVEIKKAKALSEKAVTKAKKSDGKSKYEKVQKGVR